MREDKKTWVEMPVNWIPSIQVLQNLQGKIKTDTGFGVHPRLTELTCQVLEVQTVLIGTITQLTGSVFFHLLCLNLH